MSIKILNFDINIFPIYNTIKKNNTLIKDLTSLQKKKLINNISKYDKMGNETIYLLILCYCKDKNMEIVKFPFDSILNENEELIINLEKLPCELRQLLYYFDDKIRNN